MIKSLPSPRIRTNEEVGPHHARLSGIFLSQSLAPDANLIRPISRLAHDGTFNHQDRIHRLVR